MYFIWSVSDDYPVSYWFKYDHGNGPNHNEFKRGSVISELARTPVFRLTKKISKERLLKFDDFASDGPPLVSSRFASIIQSTAPNDVQLFDADVWFNTEKLKGFKVVNITHVVPCLDLAKSEARPIFPGMVGGPLVVTKPVFLNGKQIDKMVARVAESPGLIIVSEAFAQACKTAKLVGCKFLPV